MEATRFDRLARVLAHRRSRRTALGTGGAALALVALTRAGVSTRAQEATPVAKDPVEVLYVQLATGGTFRPQQGTDGVTHELTLEGVTPHTVWFASRPDRLAGTVRTADFVTEPVFDAADPPNAALVTETAEGEVVVVVELTEPRYDATAGTATYDAVVLTGEPGEGVMALVGRPASETPPEQFGPASLFVDKVACVPRNGSCYDDRDCCAGRCISPQAPQWGPMICR